MAATTGARKSFSIQDYPEHLNPFREEDNHNKIRFWTLGRRLSRSNSINFSGIKDLKNSWALRSFMKKGKRGLQSSTQEHKNNEVNGDTSPIVYRRALQSDIQRTSTSMRTSLHGPVSHSNSQTLRNPYSSASMAGGRNTLGSPEHGDRYIYGGSVTPLPRSRFQERLRSSSQQEVGSLSSPRMARSEVSGSRLSVESNNPFDDAPVPPVRASRRKKNRAPPPPAGNAGIADVSISSETSDLTITENNEKKANTDGDLDIDETLNLNVELKIVEDEDVKVKNEATVSRTPITSNKDAVRGTSRHEPKDNDNSDVIEKTSVSETEKSKSTENEIKNADLEDDILNSASFSKVDITKYRRNSSVNDDDIRLRRGNLEDFHALSTKRSKSLTNAFDSSYVTYDINLNESSTPKDKNGNEEPQKVICKLYNETARKQSIDNSISSTEKEFLEIDKVRREFEREINKLNAALIEDDFTVTGARVSVSDMKRKFDKTDITSPNPIPKPRRSHYSDSGSPLNGNVQTQLSSN